MTNSASYRSTRAELDADLIMLKAYTDAFNAADDEEAEDDADN